jgi:hypothetical protein
VPKARDITALIMRPIDADDRGSSVALAWNDVDRRNATVCHALIRRDPVVTQRASHEA